MTVSLYNTLSKQKEPFNPLDASHVRMYVCGPTVYAPPHIGNGRPVVVFDLLFRLLSRAFRKVTYVRNITDVDDKIHQKALETNKTIYDITEETIQLFHETCSFLGALSPSVEPRVTQHIPEIISMIRALIEKGFAYEKDGHVLFRVHSFKAYGELSRKNQDELLAGARIDVAPYKENPEDFVLWKPSLNGEPAWDSPFGLGRPGWHIECSAMSAKHLGQSFDIHGGGIDLVFPHHENEIAQSEACHGCRMSSVWMHNGHLSVNGQKMSKSLGNVVLVQDLIGRVPGQVVRWALLSSHYRQPLDWNEALIQQSKAALDRIYTALEGCVDGDSEPSEEALAHLYDDLNTPAFFANIHELVHAINTTKEKHDLQLKLIATLKAVGFLTDSIEDWWHQPTKTSTISKTEIEQLLEDRLDAKQQKNFQKSDEIRVFLLEKGVEVKDSPEGQKWRRV